MKKRNRKFKRFAVTFVVVALFGGFVYFADTSGLLSNIIDIVSESNTDVVSVSLDELPAYNGEAFSYIEDGLADYNLEEESWKYGYESYSSDSIGRCTTAKALVGVETMPTEDREDISSVTPTGWENKKYDSDLVEGGWLYNRCHLIGYQLTGENDNSENLITGTRYMNVEGMLPFENKVAEYVRESGNHVMYTVTPVYKGSNRVANGVIMEAYSVEDGGVGVNFDVYCYNVQPGIVIDYSTGLNWLEE